MCGRYVLALVRQMLEDDGMPVEDAPADGGNGVPRNSYNFAPGYHGIVYRADTPDAGSAPPHSHQATDAGNPAGSSATNLDTVKYKLQSMKWGLVPFWTKRNPDFGKILKTINCRDDSLSTPGGMWASMKTRKRCVVVAQGFFEWLKVGPKERIPYFTKREDGHLMCFAGLWDCVEYEDSDDKNYTYTIITTGSNKQLKFLHDRMPVILEPGSDDLRVWLDPSRQEWSRELQSLLKPYDGNLNVYPVTKEVGKVGNNSPSFIIPLDSKENKSSIVNLFANISDKNNASRKKPRESNELEILSQAKAFNYRK
ncbi:hypothetical protein G7Z17_g13116 [Cylindrodendrum hubeiense]|uniref:Uncharacterized protein n=1 Tax=Cylindrodendrum hubeiense TaxID=595255 RepID=A0A9P5L8K2_9HYPO|nr:hypothetical protein G7Z17_g13116 [Cylindrodendrum hubeiense]